MICEYALNQNNELVFIDDVENGEKCNCTCPSCGEKMIAKNNGKIKDHHFAHSSGSDCEGYRETLLHIWSKQIIEEEQKLKIPPYNDKTHGFLVTEYGKKTFDLNEQILEFSSVEIEQRNDIKSLQPDIVGVTKDGLRLWIEIYVTHKCDDDKIRLIKENDINCVEIKIPKEIETKEQLHDFLIKWSDKDLKLFINFPYGDKIIQKNKKAYYDSIKKQYTIKTQYECNKCFENILKSKAKNDYSLLLNEYKGELKMYKWIFSYENLEDLINDKPNIENWLLPSIHKKRDYISSFGHRYYVYLETFARELTELILTYKTCLWQWCLKFPCEFKFCTSYKNGKSYVFCKLK